MSGKDRRTSGPRNAVLPCLRGRVGRTNRCSRVFRWLFRRLRFRYCPYRYIYSHLNRVTIFFMAFTISRYQMCPYVNFMLLIRRVISHSVRNSLLRGLQFRGMTSARITSRVKVSKAIFTENIISVLTTSGLKIRAYTRLFPTRVRRTINSSI